MLRKTVGRHASPNRSPPNPSSNWLLKHRPRRKKTSIPQDGHGGPATFTLMVSIPPAFPSAVSATGLVLVGTPVNLAVKTVPPGPPAVIESAVFRPAHLICTD